MNTAGEAMRFGVWRLEWEGRCCVPVPGRQLLVRRPSTRRCAHQIALYDFRGTQQVCTKSAPVTRRDMAADEARGQAANHCEERRMRAEGRGGG